MLPVPKSIAGKVIAGVWLAACLGLLVFAYVQRDVHDMPVAFVLLLAGLAWPAGIVICALVGYATSMLATGLGLPYSPFLSLLPTWLATVAFGYLQWFVVLPNLFRKFLKSR